MKHFLTAFTSTLVAWWLTGLWLRPGTSPDESAPAVSQHKAPVISAPTMTEVLAVAPGERLFVIARLGHISRVSDIIKALGRLDDLPPQEAALASQVLYKRWAELAPEHVMRYVLGKQNGDSSVLFDEFRAVLEVLRKKDPAHCLALLCKCNPYYSNESWTHKLDDATLMSAITRYPDSHLAIGLAQDIVLRKVAENPAHALALLDELPGSMRGAFLLKTLAEGWAKRDPDAALEWALKQPPKDQALCIPAILQKKLEGVQNLAGVELVFANTRESGVLKELLISLVKQNPSLAMEWFAVHGDEPVARRGLALQQDALKNIAAKNPEAVLGWLEANPGASEYLRNSALARAAEAIALTDPLRAEALAGELPLAYQISMYATIAPELAKKDLDAGLAMAVKGIAAGDTLSRIVNDWKKSPDFSKYGLQPVIDKLYSLAPEQMGKTFRLSHFNSLPSYLDFLNRLDTKTRDDALYGQALEILNADLVAAANYFAQQSPGKGQREAMHVAAMELAEKNPAAGVEWLARIPKDDAADVALANFAISYFRSNAAGAAAWIEGLPSAQADVARTAYAGNLLRQNQPSRAWEQALKLSDSVARESALTSVIEDWKDTAAARAAISSSPLDVRMQEKLQAQISEKGAEAGSEK